MALMKRLFRLKESFYFAFIFSSSFAMAFRVAMSEQASTCQASPAFKMGNGTGVPRMVSEIAFRMVVK